MKKKIIIPIVLVVLVAAVCIAVAVTQGDKQSAYEDTVATIPVTDENGLEVTDANGILVTEPSAPDSTEAQAEADATASTASESAQTAATKADEDAQSSTTKKSGKSNTTTAKQSATERATEKAAANAGGASDSKTTTAKTATTEKTTQTTTEKPKNREVTVQVALPYYNNQAINLRVRYRADGEKEYTYLKFDDPNNPGEKLEYETVTLDGSTTKTYNLGKLKGDVVVVVESASEEITLYGTQIVVPAAESSGIIKPYTGIEMMVGEDE